MSPPTYTVILNLNDDNLDNPAEDITLDVLRLEWRLGLSAPYDSVAAPGSARITVRNPTRAYSPEVAAGYTPGKRVTIRSDDGMTVRTHFTGQITHVEPLAGDQGGRLAIIYAGGPEANLSNRIRLPPQVDRRADQVLTAILDALPLRQPSLDGYWLVDIAGHMELGDSTRLAESYPSTLETGLSTFGYAADTWADGIPASVAIRQMVEAEGGRFFVDREGQFVFYNRHHTILDTAPLATLTNDVDGLDYTYGSDIANRIGVAIQPRSIGAPNTTLWTLENPQRILLGEAGVRQITARYRDAAGRPLGALSIIPPLAGVDYSANSEPDGSGEDHTNQLYFSLVESGASAAVFTIRNDSADAVYLLAGMTLRGTPIIQGDPITIDQTDWLSVSLHGLRERSYDLPALDSLEEADQFARFELSRRKDPRGAVRRIQVSGKNHLTQMLARTLFDRITITETQTGQDADYFIIAEEHIVDRGGWRHQVTWLLEPASASTFWIIGTSRLDIDAILAY